MDARNTHAFYNVDRESGGVNWTLGGKSTDFEADDDLYFAWQHDVERSPDGTITLFDNQSSPTLGDSSRGMRIDVDTDEMTAELVQEFLPPVPAHRGEPGQPPGAGGRTRRDRLGSLAVVHGVLRRR